MEAELPKITTDQACLIGYALKEMSSVRRHQAFDRQDKSLEEEAEECSRLANKFYEWANIKN